MEIISINIISAIPADNKLRASLAAGAVAAAEAQMMETTARGKSRAVQIEAKAKAEQTMVLAKADANADILRAEGAKQAADKLSSNPVSVELAKIDRTGQALVGDGNHASFFFGANPHDVQSLLANGSIVSRRHSPGMSESIPSSQSITEQQVKNLFYLWNDALATGNSTAVADRYSKNAVLLPTTSDTPRTNYHLIKDYFDSFLQKKPQGVILESSVLIGNNWAQDAGIYEFTLGINGSKLKARYSFIYVYEDGQWKISHHHSSVMPGSF